MTSKIKAEVESFWTPFCSEMLPEAAYFRTCFPSFFWERGNIEVILDLILEVCWGTRAS